MYNKYFSENSDAFSEFYRAVEKEDAKEERVEAVADASRKSKGIDLKKLLCGIDIEKVGLLPIVLLLLLLCDCDDDEKMIIIALAVIFGI